MFDFSIHYEQRFARLTRPLRYHRINIYFVVPLLVVIYKHSSSTNLCLLVYWVQWLGAVGSRLACWQQLLACLLCVVDCIFIPFYASGWSIKWHVRTLSIRKYANGVRHFVRVTRLILDLQFKRRQQHNRSICISFAFHLFGLNVCSGFCCDRQLSATDVIDRMMWHKPQYFASNLHAMPARETRDQRDKRWRPNRVESLFCLCRTGSDKLQEIFFRVWIIRCTKRQNQTAQTSHLVDFAKTDATASYIHAV